jgi:hypothetical protein
MAVRAVDPSRSRIVLVGVSEYDTPDLPAIPQAANNVADLASVFKDPQLGGFDASHCTVLSARASSAQVGDVLVKAAEEAEDLLLFYFAGHGLVGQNGEDLYLCLSETKTGGRLAFGGLSFSAIRDAYRISRAENRVVILDCCYSGRALNHTLGPGDALLDEATVTVTGTYTLAAAAGAATVEPDARHTAFTGRLLALLTEGIADAGSMLTLGTIFITLRERLKYANLPVPQQCNTDTAKDLGLVRNRKGTARVERGPVGTESAAVISAPASSPTENQHGQNPSGRVRASAAGAPGLWPMRVTAAAAIIGLVSYLTALSLSGFAVPMALPPILFTAALLLAIRAWQVKHTRLTARLTSLVAIPAMCISASFSGFLTDGQVVRNEDIFANIGLGISVIALIAALFALVRDHLGARGLERQGSVY